MPTFVLNKLVRDGLRHMYADLEQEAVYQEITHDQHIALLKAKEVEEFAELDSATGDEVAAEVADCLQIADDYDTLGEHQKAEALRQRIATHADAQSVDMTVAEAIRHKKFQAKGGFAGGTYVLRLKLRDDDKWVEYYRAEPDKYAELP